jgi:hypothetical protein
MAAKAFAMRLSARAVNHPDGVYTAAVMQGLSATTSIIWFR